METDDCGADCGVDHTKRVSPGAVSFPGEDTGMSEPRTIPIAIQSDQSPDPRPGSEL